MKYAAVFAVDRNFETFTYYDYSYFANRGEAPPSWWNHHVNGFWDGDVYWCLVEWEDD